MSDSSNFLAAHSNQYQIKEILATNAESKQYGLSLSTEDAELLALQRVDTLKEERRVEFGQGIMPKLIHTFCDSTYIEQENYVDTLIRLQEIFYLYKNESMDRVSDDTLLSHMKEAFEEESGGDLGYLEGTALEAFARKVRAGEHWTDRYKREKMNVEDDEW